VKEMKRRQEAAEAAERERREREAAEAAAAHDAVDRAADPDPQPQGEHAHTLHYTPQPIHAYHFSQFLCRTYPLTAVTSLGVKFFLNTTINIKDMF
jgi:hypothetical protein